MSNDSAAAEARLDPFEADQQQRLSAWRYNVVTVPVIRLLGLNAIAVAVLLHHHLIGAAVPQSALVAFFAAVEVYCLASWGMLVLLWDRLKGHMDIQFPLLALDLVVCVVATYVTGAERSWLFFLIALRLSDSSIGEKRTLLLAHLVPALYLAMLWYVSRFDGRPVPFGPAAVNTFTLYGTSLYFVMIGRTASGLRAKALSAIHVSRDLIAQLEEKSGRLEFSMDKAQEASREKSRLLATVSHELRTPLTAIITQTELVMEEADPAKDAAVIEDLAQVVTAARQLSEIIDDLLDVSRIETGRLTVSIERFDAVALIREVTAMIEPMVARDNNRLEVIHEGVSGSIRTDRARLRRILLILLGNAVKFTANGTVKLDVLRTGGHGAGQSVVFRVSDTGIGITEDLRATLFTPFTQGDSSTTRKYGGTGLGLVIAKRYAELIAADLSYETAVGMGTTFTLTVPVTLPVADADVEPTAPAEAGT
ncbi:MAG: HAMP domain-containing histidine kinase, partial [Acidobacteria bacterium]|nr:HAMP domain-containing histidine kinase [Acidobacteriota bacterium]